MPTETTLITVDELRSLIETAHLLRSPKNAERLLRALQIVEAILREPFTGIAKPEPLKHLAAGAWSRRLTQEHRIVYLVSDKRIDFLQARYHY